MLYFVLRFAPPPPLPDVPSLRSRGVRDDDVLERSLRIAASAPSCFFVAFGDEDVLFCLLFMVSGMPVSYTHLTLPTKA